MNGDRWLIAWGLGYAAAGASSLLVPLYAVALGAGPFLVSLLAATAALAGVPGALIWGRLADRTGRRRVFVLVALGAAAVVLAVLPTIRSVPVLIVTNALLWFVIAAAAPVLTLLVVDGRPVGAWEARIATLNTYQGYGWVLGLLAGAVWIPAAGRFLAPDVGLQTLFWVAAVAAGLGTVVAWRWLPPEPQVSAARVANRPDVIARLDRGGGRYVRAVPFATTRLYWAIQWLRRNRLRDHLDRDLQAYLTAVVLFSTGFAAFWAPLPVYLRTAFANEQVFWLFLATNLAAAVFYERVVDWIARFGPRRLQIGALGTRAVLFPLVGLVTIPLPLVLDLPVLLVAFGLIGLTWAVIAVTATGLVTRLAGRSRGQALGLYTALAGLGGAVGSLLGGVVASLAGFLATFVLSAVLVAAGAALVGVQLHLDRRETPPEGPSKPVVESGTEADE